MTRKTCSVAGCSDQGQTRRGMCREHYDMWRSYGDPLHERQRAKTFEVQQFLEKVAIPYQGDECLLWGFAVRSDGYGAIRIKGKTQAAHRLVCQARHGEAASPDMEVAHSCGNKLCVNPAHLRWATRSENHLDKHGHGTMLRGSDHPFAIMTEAQVLDIKRRLPNELQKDLAAEFGVHKSLISQISRGKVWAWL